METFSALLAICAGNLPVTGEFPTQRPVTQSLDVFCDLRLNKRLSKQNIGDLRRHRAHYDVNVMYQTRRRVLMTFFTANINYPLTLPEPWFNIKMSSYQHGLATILPLAWESPYLGKMIFILRRGPDALYDLISSNTNGCHSFITVIGNGLMFSYIFVLVSRAFNR